LREVGIVQQTALISRRSIIAQLCALSAACARTAPAEIESTSILVGGAEVAVRRRAGRGPTVVFVSGLGDGLESWEPLTPLLPQDWSFLAYSRPGLGESAPLAAPGGVFSAADAARHLHEVLIAAHAQPPYVLVGHSLGGMYIIRFAATYRDSVRALVFVDARPPGFFQHCVREEASCANRPQRPDTLPAAILAEAAGVPEAEEYGVPAALIGAIPATVITSTQVWPVPDGERVHGIWVAEQRALAATFRDHRFVEAAGTTHYVHHDDPALVVREIAVRAGAA